MSFHFEGMLHTSHYHKLYNLSLLFFNLQTQRQGMCAYCLLPVANEKEYIFYGVYGYLFDFRHSFQAQILDKEYCQAKKVFLIFRCSSQQLSIHVL